MNSPLSGIVIVELGASVAAPAAGQILGDLGAEVWKIEKTEGDDARNWGPPFIDGASATFQSLNRNKKSVVCDLRDAEQRETLVRFILEKAHVVLQNLRPGQTDALGLGAEALLRQKPDLIYCNMGAFGRTGPLADRPGYDPLMQAFGGIMSAVGEDGRQPVRVGPSIVDVGTALWAVIGILAKLHARTGGVVDVSLFETAAVWMQMYAAQYSASGELPKRAGSGQAAIVPYRAYRTADGDLVVAAGNNSLFRQFCGVLGHREWADDPRFRDNKDRVAHAAAALWLHRARDGQAFEPRMEQAARCRRRSLRAGAECRADAGARADDGAGPAAAGRGLIDPPPRPAHFIRRKAARGRPRRTRAGRAHQRDPMSYQTLALEPRDQVLVVRLNRPEVLNAINTQMGRDLYDLWTRLTADPGETRCVVLTGSGERAFCAGGDLKERDGMTQATWQAQHELFERGFMALIEMPDAGDRGGQRPRLRRRARDRARAATSSTPRAT